MKIYYKALKLDILSPKPLVLISEIDNRADENLTVKISGAECSYVFINGKRHKLSDGCTSIRNEEISSGISEVVFISGTKKLHASPFVKTSLGIERVPFDSTAVGVIETLLLSLAQRLCEAENRIKHLEEKTSPKSLLNFN